MDLISNAAWPDLCLCDGFLVILVMMAHLRNASYAYCCAVCLLQVVVDCVYVVRAITKVNVHVRSIKGFALQVFIIVHVTTAAAFSIQI